jgi:hypothetical protein
MKEVFLHHIWKMKLIDLNELKTYHGSLIEIINFGKMNEDAGPDFFNCELVINKQLWVGCIEMHVNSSDWDVHKHSSDLAYQNVILHVVWNHDKEIDYLRTRNVETLILKDFVTKEVVFNYENLINNTKKNLLCSDAIRKINWEKIDLWFNRLLIERLEFKAKNIFDLYDKSNYNWEEVTFKLFASNFGLKVNQEAFEIWSNSFPFQVFQKIQYNSLSIDSLFFGQAGFLDEPLDSYTKELQIEYLFLKNKFQLSSLNQSVFKFSSMRPYGFPTVRLAQLSAIYTYEKKLFSKINQFKNLEEILIFFQNVQLNKYWDNHFVFGKESKFISKSIAKDKIHNLIINTIIPLRFAYELSLDQLNIDYYIDMLEELKSEENNIIATFKEAGFKVKNAKKSQALIHLKKYYCDEKKCLNCAIGNEVLKP